MKKSEPKIKTSEELLLSFELTVIEAVKAANGWSRRSEAKLSKEIDELKAEILQRMGT